MVSYPECDGPWALIAVRYTERAFLTVMPTITHVCQQKKEGCVAAAASMVAAAGAAGLPPPHARGGDVLLHAHHRVHQHGTQQPM